MPQITNDANGQNRVDANLSGKTGGRKSGVYKDAEGRSFEAIVTGDGTNANEVDLLIPSYPQGSRVLTDVPIATALRGTNGTEKFHYRSHYPTV